ncbi:MAG: arylesterase [Pseudomonadota bacterium]
MGKPFRLGWVDALTGSIAVLAINLSVAWAEPITIAALGDSLTQGFGLPVAEGFVPQLEAALRDRGADVVVVNAGVSGDTTAGGLSRIDWTLTPDVNGLIVALGGNDLLRGLPPEMSRANLDGILDRAGEMPVLLVGMEAPGNFGPEFKAAFDAIYPDLAAKHGALYFEAFLAGLTDLDDLPRVMREYMQPDGIHPNAAGVALIVEAIAPAVMELVAAAEAARDPS